MRASRSSTRLARDATRACTEGGVFCQSSSVTRRCSGRSSMKTFPEVMRQGIDEDRFGLTVIGVTAPPLGRALGLAQVLPVGRSVAGAGKAGEVHEGLQQLDRGMVEGRPVPLKGPGIGGEDLGGQVLDPDPGQDQEPHVVDHLMEVALAGCRVPSDEGVPGAHLPRGRAPAQGRHQVPVEVDEVLEIRPYDQGPAQVMVAMDEEVPQRLLGTPSDHGQGQGAVIGDLSFQGSLVQEEEPLTGNMLFAPGGGIFPGGQSNFSLALQGEQEIPAGAILEPAVGLLPVPLPAQGSADLGAASDPFFPDAVPNRFQIFGADLPAADGVEGLRQGGTS